MAICIRFSKATFDNCFDHWVKVKAGVGLLWHQSFSHLEKPTVLMLNPRPIYGVNDLLHNTGVKWLEWITSPTFAGYYRVTNVIHIEVWTRQWSTLPSQCLAWSAIQTCNDQPYFSIVDYISLLIGCLFAWSINKLFQCKLFTMSKSHWIRLHSGQERISFLLNSFEHIWMKLNFTTRQRHYNLGLISNDRLIITN